MNKSKKFESLEKSIERFDSLELELEKKKYYFRTLFEIIGKLSISQNIEILINNIMGAISGLFGVKKMLFVTTYLKSGFTSVSFYRGIDKDYLSDIERELKESDIGRTEKFDTIIELDSSKNEMSKITSTFRDLDFRIFIPLNIDNELYCYILLGEKLSKEKYRSEEIDIISIISETASLFIRNVKNIAKLEETKRMLKNKVKILALINEVTAQIISQHDPGNLYNSVLKLICENFNAQSGSLMVLDKKSEILKMSAIYGKEKVEYQNFSLKVGEGIAGWVAQNKKTLYIEDVKKDDRFENSVPGSEKLKSILAVPVASKGKVHGVINLNYKLNGNSYTKDEIEAIEIISRNIAILLDNYHLFLKYLTQEKEKYKIRGILEQYLEPEIVNGLVKGKIKMKLGGEKRKISVLFADIRNSTLIIEKLEPQIVVEILNDFFSVATETIHKYNGIVDKYIGDCIMALFGLPYLEREEKSFSTVKVVECAVEIRKNFFRIIERWKRKVEFPENIGIGIGITTGEAILGNIGSFRKMQFTAIGEIVNMAQRISGISKENMILMDEQTFKYSVRDGLKANFLGNKSIKGFDKTIALYCI